MDENLNLNENLEIKEALKEFENKSQEEQKQKAPEVLEISEIPKIVKLVMKWSGGTIKEQKQAEYVLLGFVVLCVFLSFMVIFSGSLTKRGSKFFTSKEVNDSMNLSSQ